MKTDQQFGVVPSLDDLEWEWEVPDGAPLQDFLLCSVLPSLQKSSVAFVEPNESIDYGYDQMVYNNMELNDSTWYISNNPATESYNNNTNIAFNSNATTENFDNKVQQPEMSLISEPEYTVEQYMNGFEQNGERNMDNHEQVYDGRRSAGSDCSSGSWESSGSLSQEEIYEEIQRECAEIERRSSSPSESSTPEPKKRISKKKSASLRKKELNRTAAAKYREKKRIEREQKLKELHKLEARNRELLATFNSLGGEINYLKELIKEINGR